MESLILMGSDPFPVSLTTGADFGIKAATAGALKVGVEKEIISVISKGTPVGNFANIVHVAIEDVKVVGKMVSGELSMREGIDKLEQTTVSTVAGIASTGKGTAVGGFVGGAVGYMAGSKVGETIVKGAQKIRDGARKVISKIGEKVADVVSSIGNGISNAISGVLVFLGI